MASHVDMREVTINLRGHLQELLVAKKMELKRIRTLMEKIAGLYKFFSRDPNDLVALSDAVNKMIGEETYEHRDITLSPHVKDACIKILEELTE